MIIEALSRVSKVSEARLLAIAENASARYKTYEIPKRSGGTRTIHHPSKELKAIQRWITKVIIAKLPVHPLATAYEAGASIRKNAELHRNSNFTNRYDFQNFFPSITQRSVDALLKKQEKIFGFGLSPEDIRFVSQICCRYGALTIGAPSSPKLSNRVMFEFDAAMAVECNAIGVSYSRYADDIFLSSRKRSDLDGVQDLIANVLVKRSYTALKLNPEKTLRLSRRRARAITGIKITTDRRLSIGRERKREIRALIHRWTLGQLDETGSTRLRGLVSFAVGVDVEFRRSIERKYGEYTIESLIKSPLVERSFDEPVLFSSPDSF